MFILQTCFFHPCKCLRYKLHSWQWWQITSRTHLLTKLIHISLNKRLGRSGDSSCLTRTRKRAKNIHCDEHFWGEAVYYHYYVYKIHYYKTRQRTERSCHLKFKWLDGKLTWDATLPLCLRWINWIIEPKSHNFCNY